MKTITATEFKKNLGSYLDAAQNKEEVYITKNGNKIARLAPIYTEAEEYFMIKEESAYYGHLTVSYEEFLEISSQTELRLEYLNGEIFQMSSPSIIHQRISGDILYQIKDKLRNSKCEAFAAPFDVVFYKKEVKTPDVLQPDVLVLCDLEDHINENDRYVGTPTIVVEIISPSTRSRDSVYKLNTYMLSGVNEFWLVDPIQKQIMVYEFEDCELKRVKTYTSGMISSVMGFNIEFESII